jgi:hypothetical protein
MDEDHITAPDGAFDMSDETIPDLTPVKIL